MWSKILHGIKEYLSWVIAVGGLVTGIYGLTGESEFTNNVVYLVIVIDSFILLGLGIYIFVEYLKNLDIRKDSEKTKLTYERINSQLQAKIENQESAFFILEANDCYIMTTLHKFLNNLYDLTETAFEETESIENEEKDMKDHGYSQNEIEKKIVLLTKEKNKNISEKLYDDYKRFLRNVLDKAQENIEAYLKTKGYNLDVAVTVKQLVEPKKQNEKDFLATKNVYTSFRDARTWGKKERIEVAKKLYTIKENSDFIQCLSRGYYIFNNKDRNSQDYSNENTNFDKYYNCGATTLIFAKKQNNENIIYGFLACDILNEKYGNDEIMDIKVAQILDTAAHTIAVYFDNIDYNWFLCQVSEEFDSFWKMVFNNYLLEIKAIS